MSPVSADCQDQTAAAIDVLLPWPPSTNNLYATMRHSRGRFPTRRYAEWTAEAGQALAFQKAKKISGPVTVSIKLCSPTKRSFDIDNRIKPILDLLVAWDLIEGDAANVVTKITAEIGEGFTGAWVLVEEVFKAPIEKPLSL